MITISTDNDSHAPRHSTREHKGNKRSKTSSNIMDDDERFNEAIDDSDTAELMYTTRSSALVQQNQLQSHVNFLRLRDDIQQNRDLEELLHEIPISERDVEAMLSGTSLDLRSSTQIPVDTLDNPEVSLKPAADLLIFQLLLQQMQQENTVSMMGLRSLRLPCGTLALALWEDYFDIHSFIQENNLSCTVGDGMLTLIRKINSRHGVTVPLPSTFRTIQNAMKRHEAHYARQKIVFEVVIPLEISQAKRNSLYNTRPVEDMIVPGEAKSKEEQYSSAVYAVGARGSVMEAIGTMLLSCTLVTDPKNCTHVEVTGQNLSDADVPLPVTFHAYDAVDKSFNTEERVVCDMPSSEWFRDIESEIHNFYHDNTIGVLNVVLSYDATSLTKTIGSTGRYATPLYVALGNTLFSMNL